MFFSPWNSLSLCVSSLDLNSDRLFWSSEWALPPYSRSQLQTIHKAATGVLTFHIHNKNVHQVCHSTVFTPTSMLLFFLNTAAAFHFFNYQTIMFFKSFHYETGCCPLAVTYGWRKMTDGQTGTHVVPRDSTHSTFFMFWQTFQALQMNCVGDGGKSVKFCESRNMAPAGKTAPMH